MERKNIPIEDSTKVVRDRCLPLGPVVLELPEGQAECHDALSCTAITIEQGGMQLIVIVSVADIEGRHLGCLAQFTAAQARDFANSLIESANEADNANRAGWN